MAYTESQKALITTLAFIYYSAGDIRDFWIGEDGETPINYNYQNSPTIIGRFARAFEIKTEEQILTKLKELEPLYTDPTKFTLAT